MEAGTSQVVECEVRVDASPETIFDFFTDPAKAVRWMGTKATLDPRPGGVYRVEMGPHVTSGEYVEVDPPKRVSFTWGWEAQEASTPPGSSTVEIILTPEGDATIVRLVHRDLPTQQSADSHRHGWEQLYLPRLALVAGGGDAGPDPNDTTEGAAA